ncbi:MAG: hypothetical protein AAFN51_08050 [Pseudomonadota bacterium]
MRYLTIGLVLICVGLVAFLVMRKRRSVLPGPGRQEIYALKLTDYAERLRGCAEEIGQPHSDVFWDMAGHAERIRVEILDDHADLTQSRRFISHHARIIVELVEKFVTLNAKARPEHAGRLEAMVPQVHGYRDVFARVEKALIDNDCAEIEATMDALDVQLDRLSL